MGIRSLLFVIAAAAALVVPPYETLTNLNTNPALLARLASDFQARRGAQLSALAAAPAASGMRRDAAPVPPAGASWPFWYRGAVQLGNSTFNFGTVGARDVSRVDLATVPCLSAVDPVNKLWLTTDPIAGQLTTADASYIWFPDAAGNMFCLVNRTAGFDSQQAAHAMVGSVGQTIGVDVALRNGRSGGYRTVATRAWHAFGLTQNFGKTHLGAMPFWAYVDADTSDTLAFGFDQPVVDPQLPYASGNCPVENTRFVGGRYVFTNAGNVILPLAAAPSSLFAAATGSLFTAHPSCYVDGDTTKGFSPYLPDYDSAICGRC